MPHCREIALQELIGRVPGAVVQRCEHDVQARQNAVGEIEPPVREDVHFAPVQDRDLGIPLAQERDLLRLPFDALERQVARRCRAL